MSGLLIVHIYMYVKACIHNSYFWSKSYTTSKPRQRVCNTSCYVETSKLQLEVTTWLCDIIVEYIYQVPTKKRAPTTLILHKTKCSKGPTYIKVQLLI